MMQMHAEERLDRNQPPGVAGRSRGERLIDGLNAGGQRRIAGDEYGRRRTRDGRVNRRLGVISGAGHRRVVAVGSISGTKHGKAGERHRMDRQSINRLLKRVARLCLLTASQSRFCNALVMTDAVWKPPVQMTGTETAALMA